MSATIFSCRRFDTQAPRRYHAGHGGTIGEQAVPSDDDSDCCLSGGTPSPRILGLPTFFRQRDAADIGIHSRELSRLVDEGSVERVVRGLYRRNDAEITEHYTHAAVFARVPTAIVCLLTALYIHEIGTQLPWKVWIGIHHKARAPATGLPIRVVRFSGASLRYGVEDTEFEGVPGRITSPARTIVDCFRFRRVVGLDVALEAARDALDQRKATPDQIWRVAEVCRAKSLIRPVLEALLG